MPESLPSVSQILVEKPRECHNYEAQLYRGAKRTKNGTWGTHNDRTYHIHTNNEELQQRDRLGPRVASEPRVKLARCKNALNTPPPRPVVYSTDRSKAVGKVLVLLFVALWFILRSDLFYVLSCVTLLLCFSVHLALRLPRLGKREPILVLFVRLFDLRLFGFVCFLFLLVSGKGCDLWLWHSLDFSLTFSWNGLRGSGGIKPVIIEVRQVPLNFHP